MIRIGMPVIINYMDRPCTRLIAIIIRVDPKDNMAYARYLTTGTKITACYGPLIGVTPLSQFGVDIVLEGSQVRGVQRRLTVAAYRDGKPRAWQPEEDGELHSVRPEAYRLLL